MSTERNEAQNDTNNKYANQFQSRYMWGVIQLPEYLQTQHTKAQHAKYSKWMVSHTLCNNTHPPTILRFTINVCNNQSNSLHVQNEKETNNEAGNEHTPTTMLHDLVFNHRLKKHSYPQCWRQISYSKTMLNAPGRKPWCLSWLFRILLVSQIENISNTFNLADKSLMKLFKMWKALREINCN